MNYLRFYVIPVGCMLLPIAVGMEHLKASKIGEVLVELRNHPDEVCVDEYGGFDSALQCDFDVW